MKIIITGGRDYKQTHTDWIKIKNILCENNCTGVLSGSSQGADLFGIRLAISLSLPIYKFPAKWDTYGNMAGPMRNEEMAQNAEAVILMKGGRGTSDMRRRAIAHGLKILYDDK